MLKILLVLIALTPSFTFASIITHSKKELVDANYILSMSNQYYADKYQTIVQLIKDGDLSSAKKALAYILTTNPNDIVALDISGNILLAENKIPQAMNAFQRVISQRQSPEVMAKLGVCNLLQKNMKQAKLWLTQSLSLLPNNELALRYLAWLEQQSFNPSAQLHYLRQLVSLSDNKTQLFEYHLQYLTLLVDNNNIDVALNFIDNNREKLAHSNEDIIKNINLIEIELLLKANKVEQATEKFTAIATPTIDNDYATNYQLLAVYYYASLKEYTKAEHIIEKYLANNKAARVTANYSLATRYFDHGDFQSAHNKLNQLLTQETQLAKRISYVDDIVANYSAQSRYGDAIKFIKKQVDKNKDVPQFQHQLAELYILSGRKKAAHTQLDNVMKQFPQYVPSFIVKGRQLIKDNDEDSINSFYQHATQQFPKNAELWLDVAKYDYSQNKPQQAIAMLEKALTSINNNPLLSFELATLYDSQNLLEKSEPLYIKILQNYPEYLPALDNLASNFFAMNKDLDKAAVLAKRAFLLAPNDPFIKNLRAQAFVFENQYHQAIELLTPVISNFGKSGLGDLTLANAYYNLQKNELATSFVKSALSKQLPDAIKQKASVLQQKLVAK